MVATTSTAHVSGDDDRARPHTHPCLGEDTNVVMASAPGDRVLVPTGDDDADVDIGMEGEEVDLEPRPPQGMPKTMRELAESYTQREGEVTPPRPPPPPPREEEEDLTMAEPEGRRERVLEEGASGRGGEGPGRRTTKRRPGMRTTRTSRKRARRRGESGGASDVDGEEVQDTPPKRRHIETSVSVSPVPVPALASTTDSNPGSGRVLRPRSQERSETSRRTCDGRGV